MIALPVEQLPEKKRRVGKVYKLLLEFLDSDVAIRECINDGSYKTNISMYTALWMCIKNHQLQENINLIMRDGKVFLVKK